MGTVRAGGAGSTGVTRGVGGAGVSPSLPGSCSVGGGTIPSEGGVSSGRVSPQTTQNPLNENPLNLDPLIKGKTL